ncbi:MAG TPA: hypothetical protein VGH19_01085 [Verrucomicrobiae bacterium]
MQTGTKEIGVILALVLLAGVVVVVASAYPVPGSRRFCGHPDERFKSVDGFLDWVQGVRHHCKGGKLIADLKMLQLAQKMHLDDTGRYAANEAELVPYLGSWFKTNYYIVNYSAGANQWSVAVDRSQYLPGHYLLTGGKVHFHETNPATTNDVLLAVVETDR